MSLRRLLSLSAPGGILLLIALVVFRRGWIPVHWWPRGPLIFWVVLAAGTLLGWRFNRTRPIFALLALGLVERAMALPAVGPLGSGELLRSLALLLLPLDLALIGWLKERGLVNLRGLLRLGFLLLQPVAAVLLARIRPVEVQAYLAGPLPWFPVPGSDAIPPIAWAAFGLSFLLLGLALWRRAGRIEAGLFWSQAAALYGLAGGDSTDRTSLGLVVAGLILLAALIEESFRLAFHDELTGLPGRRSLNEALLQLGSTYSVAMVDVDHFKRFNDRHGHDAGDQVLRMVASRLSTVGGGGRAYRYGGEEFTLLFPGRSVDEALPHAERIRKRIAGKSFVIRSPRRPRKKPKRPRASRTSRKRVRVQVSIGLAQRDEAHPTPESVVQAADRALYRAKKAGRNRVCT